MLESTPPRPFTSRPELNIEATEFIPSFILNDNDDDDADTTHEHAIITGSSATMQHQKNLSTIDPLSSRGGDPGSPSSPFYSLPLATSLGASPVPGHGHHLLFGMERMRGRDGGGRSPVLGGGGVWGDASLMDDQGSAGRRIDDDDDDDDDARRLNRSNGGGFGSPPPGLGFPSLASPVTKDHASTDTPRSVVKTDTLRNPWTPSPNPVSSDAAGETPSTPSQPPQLTTATAIDQEAEFTPESLSMTPTALLETIFPNIPSAEVLAVLEECDYDIPAVLERLMEVGEGGAGGFSAASVGSVSVEGVTSGVGSVSLGGIEGKEEVRGGPPAGGKQICRHFMAGSCYRADCWFSHSLDSTVCKFWLRGGCVRGDSCAFSHGAALVTSTLHHPRNGTSSPTATPPPPAPTASAITHSKKNLDNHHHQRRIDDLPDSSVTAFPKLGSPHASSSSSGVKIDLIAPAGRYNEAVKRKVVGMGNGRLPVGVAAVAPAGTSVRLRGGVGQGVGAGAGGEVGKVRMAGVGWVSTGASVGALYSKARKEAAAAAVERNKLFQ
ncbi:hypothetical protein HDU67_009642, partial [Dinochytrium kinnereticum]